MRKGTIQFFVQGVSKKHLKNYTGRSRVVHMGVGAGLNIILATYFQIEASKVT